MKQPARKPGRKKKTSPETTAETGPPPKNVSRKSSRKITDAAGIETLFKRRTKTSTSVAEVIEKSDMDPKKIRNILFRMVKQGKLERVSRGVYRWVRNG